MKSFRGRITVIIAISFLVLSTLVMLFFNAFAVLEIAHHQKKVMKAISRSILETLAEHELSGDIPPEIIAELNEKVAFADRDKDVSFAIVSRDYQIRYHTPGFNISLDREFIDMPHQRQFLHSVSSGEGIDDMLAEWQFLFRAENETYIVFVSDYGNYELVERLIEGMAIALLITLILAIPLGMVISAKTLRPLDMIRETVLQIRAGDLSARVPPSPLQDEIGQLMTTLNETFAELEDSFTRIGQFSADAAHELGTPLAALQGNLDVCLAKERDVAAYRQVLAESFAELASLSAMIKDLLLLARPGSGGRHFRQVDLSKLVTDERERLESLAEARDVTLHCNLPASAPIQGDAALLTRMLRNVACNAIQFSPQGSIVTIDIASTVGQVEIRVSDTGPGIPAAEQEKIFERFYQVDSSRHKGTGLGLPIARWIARFHGGDIQVTSTPGAGATFTITLNPQHGE